MEEIKVITIYDDENYLRQVSAPVDLKDKDLDMDIEKLEKYCLENDVYAMASVQIGIPKRLVYLKNTSIDYARKIQNNTVTEEEKNFSEARVLINPVIKSREGLTTYWENCASCLDNMGLVKRPYKIEVEYEDRNREKHLDIFIGFETTVLSHEMDHLDGILHMDIAEEVINMPLEKRKEFRKTHDYTILAETGNFEDLI